MRYAIAVLYVIGFFGLMIVPLIDPDEVAGFLVCGAAAIGAVSH